MEAPAITEVKTNAGAWGHCNPMLTRSALQLTEGEAAVLRALLRGVPRERVDRLATVSNGPQFIADLRGRFDLERGTDVFCVRRCFKDKNGRMHSPGTYHLSERGRARVLAILAANGGAR